MDWVWLASFLVKVLETLWKSYFPLTHHSPTLFIFSLSIIFHRTGLYRNTWERGEQGAKKEEKEKDNASIITYEWAKDD